MADTDVAHFQGVDFSYFNQESVIGKDERESSAYTHLEDITYANEPAIADSRNHGNTKTEVDNPSPQSSRSSGSKTAATADGNVYYNTVTSNSPAVSAKSQSEDNSDTDSLVQLKGGDQLLEESGTETGRSSLHSHSVNNDYVNSVNSKSKQPLSMASSVISLSNGSGTAKARAAKSPYSSPSSDSIPEEEITIPNDANVSSYTADQLANFLRCFKVEDRIISHLHRKQVDGKRFSRLRDSELESLGMKNSVIMFFRDRSNVKASKKKQFFVL